MPPAGNASRIGDAGTADQSTSTRAQGPLPHLRNRHSGRAGVVQAAITSPKGPAAYRFDKDRYCHWRRGIKNISPAGLMFLMPLMVLMFLMFFLAPGLARDLHGSFGRV